MGSLGIIKNYLFPYFCADCGKEGEWWCKDCRGEIKPFLIGAAAPQKATALFSYRGNPAVEKLIKEYKYEYARDVNILWKEILEKAKLSFNISAVFIAVPLHERRRRERGFNQAEEIAEILSVLYGRPMMLSALRRIRETSQQAGMARAERLKNVAGAFAWIAEYKAPEHVVLVDDVYTTGSTIGECARVLREHGTKNIEVLVLAHG